ncbi:YsnF/AvaK domain-containing protein [Tunturiibacter gelidoferens]|jgi:uncharacterized protein (TIGR02271 family)|uniref:Uncharacterized protein (TIGR02271 family) n=1 Tax=Tunturiibacter gelidiferens TaxID=3069689 RepID=A0A9X0U412_9BACT|nr:YsnF/AvaK domain-containing protein [Edaphobacter lichenicola]MBB5328480.1 uncharacterized protein (TIGR02271 family) [Edaphobacter lichenicola]
MNPSLDKLGAVDTTAVHAERETVIPLLEEQFSVAKRVVETARVRVSRVTHDHQQLVDELLNHEKVEVEHVPVDRPIETMPSIRQEGDVTIIPVVEEVLKVERCLVLKEEVHIRRIKTTERHQEQVTLRKQEVLVARTPIEHSEVPD